MHTNERWLPVIPFSGAKFVCAASAPVYMANGRVQSKYFARFLFDQWVGMKSHCATNCWYFYADIRVRVSNINKSFRSRCLEWLVVSGKWEWPLS